MGYGPVRAVPFLITMPSMTPAEVALAQRAAAGDVEARNEIIVSMLPWIYTHAYKFQATTGLNPDDLAQAAVLKIIQGFHSYNPARGLKPITYFGKCILHAMVAEICTDRTIRKPTSADTGEETKAAGEKTRWVLSLQMPLPGTEHKELGDTIPNAQDRDAGDGADVRADVKLMRLAIAKLDRRMREVLESRLRGEKLKQIGERLGITRERVRQIENDAKEKIRIFMVGKRRQSA